MIIDLGTYLNKGQYKQFKNITIYKLLFVHNGPGATSVITLCLSESSSKLRRKKMGLVNIITVYGFSTRGPEFDSIALDMGIAVDTLPLGHDFL